MRTLHSIKHSRNGERGSALLISLLLLLVLGMGSAAIWQGMHLEFKSATDQRHRDEAYYLAEAGMRKALAELRAQPDYAGEEQTSLGGGYFTVSVSAHSGGDYSIRSQGVLASDGLQQAQYVLQAEVTLNNTGQVLRYLPARKRLHG